MNMDMDQKISYESLFSSGQFIFIISIFPRIFHYLFSDDNNDFMNNNVV